MAKIDFSGIDEYVSLLEKVGNKNALSSIKYAVYPGAAVVADAIRAELEANHGNGSGDLAGSLTLADMRNDEGYINTKVTFAGYDSKGTPNALKAAALESGTSRGQDATHFISKTVKSVKERAISEMSKALDEKLKQYMEG